MSYKGYIGEQPLCLQNYSSPPVKKYIGIITPKKAIKNGIRRKRPQITPWFMILIMPQIVAPQTQTENKRTKWSISLLGMSREDNELNNPAFLLKPLFKKEKERKRLKTPSILLIKFRECSGEVRGLMWATVYCMPSKWGAMRVDRLMRHEVGHFPNRSPAWLNLPGGGAIARLS